MRATLRRNGQHMVTLTTRHNLNARDIAVILYRSAGLYSHGFEMGQRISRALLERGLRMALAEDGRGAIMSDDWAEDVSEDERAETMAWAVEQVQRLMPELAGDPELSALLDSV